MAATLYPPSLLDANQVLQHVYDETTQGLRVNTEATIVAGAFEVAIDHITDSIKVGDGLTFLDINPDGSINVNITGGALEVIIDHTNDSIKIGDGIDFLAVNADGSINTTVIGAANPELFLYYDEITSVPTSIETTIQTFIALAPSFLKQLDVSGTNIAEYRVYLNTALINKKRTYFGGDLNTEISYSNAGFGLALAISDVVEIKVIHIRPDVGDFNSSLYILES